MAIGASERVGVVPGADATAVARMRAAGAILLGKTNCPEYGGGYRDGQPGPRPHLEPLRPGAHARREQRRRGGDRRGGGLPVRARHRLGRQRAPAGPLLRPRVAQAERRARPAHRRARRRGAARHARRPAHAGRPAGALGRGRRAAAARRGGSRRARRRGRAGRAGRARGRRAARPARRRADRERPRRPHSRDGRRRRGGGGRAAGGGRERRGRAPSRRRARADDRGLALVRGGRPGRRAVAPPAPLGRVPHPHARVRRRATTCCCARCSTDPRGRTGR